MFSSDDHRYMGLALRLAQRGLYTTDPNPRVGCVIVRDGSIVGQGWHMHAGEPHAEVHALQEAGDQARGATVYVTLEPCSHHGRTPPCADALLEAGVGRVVVAMEDPNPKVAGQGNERLKAAAIDVTVGLMQPQAEALNPGFISRHRRGRPYVRCKLAMSLDGRTAMADGESKWITSEAARNDVQKLRARSSVIVTGINTVLADDPRLNARVGFEVKQPDRVVLDSTLRMPRDATMLSLPGTTWIAALSDEREKRAVLEQAGARFIGTSGGDGRVNLAGLLKELHDLEYNEVLVEAGPTLSGAFVQAGLVDELIVYMAPQLMGDGGRALLHLPGIDTMQQRINLKMTELKQVGDDLRLTFAFA
jgi:diaminohydroxyphosphoribosylaminopyrimidine deaminase/5-amino-6-(5-phosphoribosylamino)uracil reductase